MSFEDYNDLCAECINHDRCHSEEINYTRIKGCKKELTNIRRRELRRLKQK